MKLRPTILLINLGTPNKPSVTSVRRYLKEFLMDGRVINLPYLFRWLLVHFIILPFRPKRSSSAYQKVWTPRGSPLMVYGEELAEKLQVLMGKRATVKLAMRYGNPSLSQALDEIEATGSSQILIFPLYPQYAAATTGSTVARLYELALQRWNVPPFSIISDYYNHPRFIQAYGELARPQLEAFNPDHVLFSYHGLPEDHLYRTSPNCLQGDHCCEQITAKNRFCYRAQCYATSSCLSKELKLDSSEWSQAFQSRLGRAEWIKPYTADQIVGLANRGIKRLVVMCPAFTADCLETIEEIGMEAQKEFKKAGGEEFLLIPALNSSGAWVKAVQGIVEEYLQH